MEEILYNGFNAYDAINGDGATIDASRTRNTLPPHWLRRLLADRRWDQIEAHDIRYVSFSFCLFSCVFNVLLIFALMSFPFFVDGSRSEGEGLGKRGDQWTEVLSWEPRAFVYHNFLVSFYDIFVLV